jgi:hypothetical protein
VGQEKIEIPFATLGDGDCSRGDQGSLGLIGNTKLSGRKI